MSSPYTPIPAAGTWATATFPTDGDNKNVASIRVGLEALADKLFRMLDRAGGHITGSVFFDNGSVLELDDGTALVLTPVGTFASYRLFQARGGLTIDTAGTLDCQRPASFTGSTLQGGGTTSVTFQKDVTFSSGTDLFECAGPVRFDSTLVQVGDATFFGLIKSSGTGHIRQRTAFGVTLDADHPTATIADADRWLITGLGANRTYTFKNTGAALGDVIALVVSGASGHNVVVKRDDGTTLITLQDDAITGHVSGVELWHNGTNWQVGLVSVNP